MYQQPVYQQPCYPAQPDYYQQQPNYYDQNQQIGYQQDMNYYQNDPQFQNIMPQQIYIQPQQPISEPMYMPPPVIMEPQIVQQPQSKITVQKIDREDYNTQDMQTWTKSRLSQELYCLKCHKVIKSQISYEMGGGSWFMMFVFCCLPICVDSMKDVKHTCPYCHKQCGHHVYLC